MTHLDFARASSPKRETMKNMHFHIIDNIHVVHAQASLLAWLASAKATLVYCNFLYLLNLLNCLFPFIPHLYVQ